MKEFTYIAEILVPNIILIETQADKQMLLSSPNSAQIVLDDNKNFNTDYFIQNQLNDDHHAIIFFC